MRQRDIGHRTGTRGGRGAIALVLAVALQLGGCTSVRLTEGYDPEIEKTVNAYHENVVAFVKRMELNAGTAEGDFDNPGVKEFYATAEGQLANLVVRAEAANPAISCTPAGRLVTLLPSYVAAVRQQTEDAALDMEAVDLNSGNCTVVVLKSMQADEAALKEAHKSHRYLRPSFADTYLNLINDGVRLALLNEQAKK